MFINEMNLSQIEARMAEIATEMEAEGADLDALTNEVNEMTARRKDLEQREELRKMVAAGNAGTTVRKFADTKEERKPYAVNSEEYRVAYLKVLQGKELNAEEKRAYTVASGATATITMDRIMDVVRKHAWLLERMTTIYANAKVEYYIEGTTNAAQDHTENQTISADADTLTKITLTPSEITKMVQVSEAASAMSINAFEAWLTEHIGKAIARKINEKIITVMMAGASSAGSAIDAATVQALLGSIKGDDIALVCNNKTLYTKLLPLEDKSKHALVTFENGEARIYGRPVLVDDHMSDDELLGGDMSKAIAAIAEDVTVRRQYDIDTNSTKFLGVTVFDVKLGLAAGFAKIAGA